MSIYTVGQILQSRRPLLCVRDTDRVAEAVRLMLTSQIAQLPVVDADGNLQGLISQQSILSIYYYSDGQVNLLRASVAHCCEPVATLSVHDDMLAVVDQLSARGVAAVVITDAGRPVGILTGRDMSHYFRTIFEGLLLIEQIEGFLRACITRVFPTAEEQRQAQLAGAQPERAGRPVGVRELGALSLTGMLRLITAPAHWQRFDPLLGPKALFEPLMEHVRQVRNAIAHFQGQPAALDLDTLRRASHWLANRGAGLAPPDRRSAATPIPELRPHQLSELVALRKHPLCIGAQEHLGSALQLMVEHQYAQLPVVNQAGTLLGLVAQPTILSLYYLTDGEAPLLTLPLHHALLPAAELAEEASFFKAVEQLSSPGKAAVVVTRDQLPIGILTGKDMTLAFRALCEGIILVERIELMLRDQIGRAYPAEEALNAAAVATFGPDPEHPHYALRNPHKLGLGDTIQLISDPDNWPCFEPILGPRVVFLRLMERVREIRNQLLHFRGQLSPLDREALVRTDTWLKRRPAWPVTPPPAVP